MIIIVDTGVANRYSIRNALEYIGCKTEVSADPQKIRDASKLVFPGVGAFAAGMKSLRERDLIGVLTDEIKTKGKPVLGICLGMQMMVTKSLEDGEHGGLDLIPGVVRPLAPSDPACKVPHIGFNTVTIRGNEAIFRNLPPQDDFYFVHSYYVDCDPSCVAATFEHGGTFTAAIAHGNIVATQFHVEKSQAAGLQVLRNFVELE
jgi:glutamine amidotransferase